MHSIPMLLIAAALAAPGDVEVVKFTAEWCAPCRAMEPALEQLSQQGFQVTRIDIDQRPELASRYQVTSVPTVFLVSNGKIVDRINGAVNHQQLSARLQRAAGKPVDPQPSPKEAPAHEPPAGQPLAGSPPARQPPAHSMASSAARGNAPRSAEPGNVSNAERFARQATVRLQIEDANGHSYGTGTIVHMHGQDALILTCGHIFRDSKGKGRISIDLFAEGSKGQLTGELIRFDLDRDLALVGVRVDAKIQPVRVAGSAYHVAMGQRLFSMGCDKGRSPTVLRGQLRAVNKYLGPENLVVSGQPTDGRSGGGLFSHDGQLVGVCNAADPEENEGLYAAFASVHRHLDEAKLAFVYRQGTGETFVAAAPTTNPEIRPATHSANPSSMDAPLPVRPASAITRRDAGPSASQNLARGAQGAEPNGAEVICIIRPKNRPHDKSEVVVLDRPSRDFITQLNRELNRQSHRQATQMRVRGGSDDVPRDASTSRGAQGRGWQPNAVKNAIR